MTEGVREIPKFPERKEKLLNTRAGREGASHQELIAGTVLQKQVVERRS